MGTGISLFSTRSLFQSVQSFAFRSGFAYCLLLSVLPNPFRARVNLFRHSFSCIAGTGLYTSCPSATHFCLVLGPDLPRADEPSPGNLGLSVCRILTCISLLTPAFSLPNAPALLPVCLLRCLERSPTTYTFLHKSIDSVLRLAPVNFRRRDTRLVSCYALF